MATKKKSSGGSRTASGGSRAASGSRSSGGKRTTGSGSRASSSRSGSAKRQTAPAPKPFRREVGALVCLLLAIFAAFGYFHMKALFIADTADFGIVRIFCDTPKRAVEVLGQAGFRASLTPVIAVSVEDAPGTLADLLGFCQGASMNIEYGY